MKKFVFAITSLLLIIFMAVPTFALVDNGTLTFENPEPYGPQWDCYTNNTDTWCWVCPIYIIEGPNLTADQTVNYLQITDEVSYKGLNSLKWTTRNGGILSTNLSIHGYWSASNDYTGAAFPKGATLRWYIYIPSESPIKELWYGYNASPDGTVESGAEYFSDKYLDVDLNKKDTWQIIEYSVPSSQIPIDTFICPVYETEFEGTVMYIDSISYVDRDGNIVRSKDYDGTKDGGVTEEVTLPEPVSVEGITVNTASLELIVGENKDVKATITPSNARNQNVFWSSSDTTVAKVMNNGKIIAVKEGTAVITVKTDDGGFEAKVNVTVKPKAPEKKPMDLTMILIIGGAVLLVVVIAVVIVVSKKKKNKNVEEINS